MIQAGQLITDGTAVFIVDDVRDGNRVGDIIMRHTLREGFIKANGAVVAVSDYPRLVRYARDNGLAVSEEAWQAGQYAKYVYDSDAGTLRLPNIVNRVLEGGDEIATLAAGLPNITGGMSDIMLVGSNWNVSGAFKLLNNWGTSKRIDETVGASGAVDFNAARSSAIYGASNTVQPPAIKLIAQIKY